MAFAGWAWSDGLDTPLAEERETYRVTLVAMGGTVQAMDTQEPWIVLPRPAPGTRVEVVQGGTLAVSAPATLVL